jgi:hypothetical protein
METNSTNPKEDLQAIREIMERSSRFLSLSGLSGIFSGVCALLGAAAAWFFILDSGHLHYDEQLRNLPGVSTPVIRNYLALDALLVLGFALLGAFYFSYRKARKTGQQFWNLSSRRLLLHLMIPLVTGGIFTPLLVLRNNLDLVPAILLIFYGLALVSAGKFTLGEIHYLGLTEIVLGILAAIFIQQGMLLWTVGFGLVHIVYGAVMYYRHER